MPTGNPSRKGTTAYAIHEALRIGGGMKQIKRNALRVFEDTNDKDGNARAKAKSLLKNSYLTPNEIIKITQDLKKKGYLVRVKGKGDDLYIKVSDG